MSWRWRCKTPPFSHKLVSRDVVFNIDCKDKHSQKENAMQCQLRVPCSTTVLQRRREPHPQHLGLSQGNGLEPDNIVSRRSEPIRDPFDGQAKNMRFPPARSKPRSGPPKKARAPKKSGHGARTRPHTHAHTQTRTRTHTHTRTRTHTHFLSIAQTSPAAVDRCQEVV